MFDCYFVTREELQYFHKLNEWRDDNFLKLNSEIKN